VFIKPNVAQRVTGIATAAMTATLKGRRIIVTRITEAMASINSWVRVFILSFTTVGWSAMRSSEISGGRIPFSPVKT